MPNITPEHKIEFHMVDEDSSLVIPPVNNPAYIYKVGDRFRYFSADISEASELTVMEFEVVEVTHELQDHVVGEQCIVVHVKEVTNASGKGTS